MSLRFGSNWQAIYFLICSCTFICSAPWLRARDYTTLNPSPLPRGLKSSERREAGRGAGVHAPQAESHSGRMVGNSETIRVLSVGDKSSISLVRRGQLRDKKIARRGGRSGQILDPTIPSIRGFSGLPEPCSTDRPGCSWVSRACRGTAPGHRRAGPRRLFECPQSGRWE